MAPADIPAGLRLCRASRWNQLAPDWELFLKLSPHGCRVAVKNGQAVGTVTTVRYQDRFGWIGMVLVDPAERGHGVGTQLLYEALEILEDMESVRLDATPAGQLIYQKTGFLEEYRLSRMETVVSGQGLPSGSSPARPMTREDLPGVLELDREVFGADRLVILESLLARAPEFAWVSASRGRIEAYSFGRHGFSFEHLGPVVAQDEEWARHLVSTCLAGQTRKPFILDATRHTAGWPAWLESLGFREQRPFVRMFRGANRYPGRPEKQFAILGPEFG